ncbi:hypothetical protein [Pseudomonas fluorescens group sp. PF-69]
MNKKYERFGLRLEITGMLLLFFATFWEAQFSGWWSTQSVELQSSIQEEVNLAVLEAISDIAAISAIDDDPALVKRIASHASRATKETAVKAIEMREDRLRASNNQGEHYSKIKLWLFCLGAIFMILGKILFLRACNPEGTTP